MASSTGTTTTTSLSKPLYSPDATICLIGMRGVGKTTLGLIAATSLRRSFIDADSAFQTLHGPISTYVNAHGWSSFRDAETVILKKLLEEHTKNYVIACGGGVVERSENREMLRAFRKKGGVIVHVVRDKEETLRYLVDEAARPSWGEEIRSVWARRTPYFESLATHTIVSLTAHPRPLSPQFLMKHVETAFVRLLRSIFGLSNPHVPLTCGPLPVIPTEGGRTSSGLFGGYGAECESEMGRGTKGPRTSFVALNFPDLRIVEGDVIRKVAEGVDVIELRVDALCPSFPETPPESRRSSPDGARLQKLTNRNGAESLQDHPPPTPHFVALCFGHLRRCSPLPIIYTVRTKSQGGFFPDPYSPSSSTTDEVAPEDDDDDDDDDDDETSSDLLDTYIALVELGFKLGAEYVDIELGLPDKIIKHFLSMRGSATKAILADHDRKGEWRWDSPLVEDKYDRARALGGDVLKLVSYPTKDPFYSNLELLKFRQKVDKREREGGASAARLPLLAINLGKSGQLTRFLNPVLTPVTHPLLPGVAAPGQLTFAQTQHALYLSGLILEKTFFVPSLAVVELFTKEVKHLGLPYTFLVEDRLGLRELEQDFGGAFLSEDKAIVTSTLPPTTSELLSPAASSGWSDVLVPSYVEPPSYDVPPSTDLTSYKYTNVRVLALAEVISVNLSPINAVGVQTSALLVGLNSKERKECIEALNMVGARWVTTMGCEGDALNEETSANRDPRSRAQTPSSLPYPHQPTLTTNAIPSFSSPILYTRRPPTIIIASNSAPSFPDSLFASATGGAALDLSSNGRGELREAIVGKKGHGGLREGWQLIGGRDVEMEVERQAFRALTGRRLGTG